MNITDTLLIEFLTEELPPINLLKNIGEAFANGLSNEIKSCLSHDSQVQVIASPRRFGCLISNVARNEETTVINKKGPAVATALTDGVPNKALSGFMRSCGITDIKELTQLDGYFYAQQQLVGKSLVELICLAIPNALKKLPIAKSMRWGNNEFSFVRPVHNILVMHGNHLINLQAKIFDLPSTNFTYGHRILSPQPIVIDNANNYFNLLQSNGYVIADFTKRKQNILKQLQDNATLLSLKLNYSDNLLDEVTAITEYPVVMTGEFAKDFLEVPQECLILSMEKNQKYFALLDSHNKLTNKFLLVANINSTNPNIVVQGNERVLSARLADAKFFYDFDRKNNLAHFTEKLAKVVYHNKIGSQLERIARLQNIAGQIGKLLAVPNELAEHTAYLMKADLATEMVGEFPELQGIVGKYYALYQNEKPEVANAIEQHYYPRFSNDDIPSDNLSVCVALADKLETIFGIWGIGLLPTGDKDPFGLRRMALGIVRILLNHNLNLIQLLELTKLSFVDINLAHNTLDEVYVFILQRLVNYLIDNDNYQFETKIIHSICATSPQYFNHIPSLAVTLQNFAGNSNNQLLIAANKRIENIIKKNTDTSKSNCEINPHLFSEMAEKQLYNAIIGSQDAIANYSKNHEWQQYFAQLEQFNSLVSSFFDNVMVMDNNPAIQANRIALVSLLYKIMNHNCKLSELNI
jgi:glycyl-tRNA synthetase beta chain